MKVELVFRVVLGPGYLLKPVGFCVDELCILWNWLVWIPESGKEKKSNDQSNRYNRSIKLFYVPAYSLGHDNSMITRMSHCSKKSKPLFYFSTPSVLFLVDSEFKCKS